MSSIQKVRIMEKNFKLLDTKPFFFFCFGIALKCFRRSFECELCVNNNTDVNHLFGSILDLCANCCMFILKNWNKLEQYMNELGNNDMYDFELRKALLNNYDHNNKGNQITLLLIKSVEIKA